MLQKNMVLTLENTQVAIEEAHIFMQREDKTPAPTVVACTTMPNDPTTELAVLRAEVEHLRAVMDRRGGLRGVRGGLRGGARGGGRGGDRESAPRAAGDVTKKCPKCGGNHDEYVCFKLGDELVSKADEMKKQTETIEEQTVSILVKRKHHSTHPVATPSLVSSPTLGYHDQSFKSYPNEVKKIRHVVCPNNDFRS